MRACSGLARKCTAMHRLPLFSLLCLFEDLQSLRIASLDIGRHQRLSRISIAVPGLPLLNSDPDMCPWMLVVVYYLVYILSYFVFEI